MHLNEKLSFLVALIAISLAVGTRYLLYGDFIAFSIIVLAVSTAFFPHELMHRFVARKLGCYSRFVLDPLGLFLTLLSSLPFMLWKIIIPGYVLISSHYYDPATRKYIEGVSASVGPLTNIVIGTIGFLILYTLPLQYWFNNVYYLYIFVFLNTMVFVNVWIAFFNLLPIPPLDGSKIISWKPITWIAMFVTVITLMFLIKFF